MQSPISQAQWWRLPVAWTRDSSPVLRVCTSYKQNTMRSFMLWPMIGDGCILCELRTLNPLSHSINRANKRRRQNIEEKIILKSGYHCGKEKPGPLYSSQHLPKCTFCQLQTAVPGQAGTSTVSYLCSGKMLEAGPLPTEDHKSRVYIRKEEARFLLWTLAHRHW